MASRTTPCLFAVLLAASCAKAPNGSSGGAAPSGESAGVAAASPATVAKAKASTSPRSQQALPTTDPAIAIGNFDGEFVAAQQMLAKDPRSVGGHVAMTSLLLMRGALYGKLADYDTAATMSERAVALAPKEPKVWLARAAVHSRFHEFPAALADLDRAAKLGGGDVAVEVMQRRASIQQAMGQLTEARPVIERLARELPSLQTIGTLATLDVDSGDPEKAEREFNEALDHFPAVSPFPLVWLWLQQANMWEAEGSPARAAELLEAAHARMPADVAVTSHWAGAEVAHGHRAHAVALLRTLVAGSDDPEYAGQLAELLGDSAESTQLRERARRGYEALLARHPAAFADHAARFYLASRTALPRALQLAELNLRVRQTAPAFALVIDAALANDDRARACAVASAAKQRGATSGQLAWQSARAFAACGKPTQTTASAR